jgi:hypothetical protein
MPASPISRPIDKPISTRDDRDGLAPGEWHMITRRKLAFTGAALIALALLGALPSAAAEGVLVLVPGGEFRGSMGELQAAQEIAVDRLPLVAEGVPVLVAGKCVVAFDEAGQASLYARREDSLVRHSRVAVETAPGKKSYRIVAADRDDAALVEVSSGSAAPDYRFELTADGICRIHPGRSQRLVVRDARLRYAVVPSFIAGDFIYHAGMESPGEQMYVPALGMLVGLAEGESSMLAAVWPPGKQTAGLVRNADGAMLDGFTFDMAGEPLALSFLETPGIWHAEPLKPEYLERDTAIGWKRPLEARWIGNFFVDSEAIDWPFYFRHERVKLWGRWIRGWFYYPLWFEGDRTMVHFEKRFPPMGDLLIYYLEDQPSDPGHSPGSPVGVMRRVLGKEQTARGMDFEGVEMRPLLAHMMAVCAMTNTMQQYFDAGEEGKRRPQIDLWCDDVADFIGMIRDRVFEFDRFAAELSASLARRAEDEPKLAAAVEQLQGTLAEIRETAKNDLPATSLETVRGWTDEMKSYAAEVRPGNNKRYEKLAAQCRSVAGTQDDLARALSILAIRLTQEAARAGMESPEHARLAQDVIAQARLVIRRPTWWEPRREYLPKSDPGRP